MPESAMAALEGYFARDTLAASSAKCPSQILLPPRRLVAPASIDSPLERPTTTRHRRRWRHELPIYHGRASAHRLPTPLEPSNIPASVGRHPSRSPGQYAPNEPKAVPGRRLAEIQSSPRRIPLPHGTTMPKRHCSLGSGERKRFIKNATCST